MDERLRKIIEDAVADGVAKAFAGPFTVDPKTHWEQHQLLSECQRSREETEANHAFVAELRKGAEVMKGAALKSIIAALVTAALAGLVLLFRKV